MLYIPKMNQTNALQTYPTRNVKPCHILYIHIHPVHLKTSELFYVPTSPYPQEKKNTRPHNLILSAIILYSFLFFCMPLPPNRTLATPIHLLNPWNRIRSLTYAVAKLPNPSAKIKNLKGTSMYVSSMAFITHCAGSKSMYKVIAKVTNMVVTNGKLRDMGSRYGFPTLRTTAERMYWKQLVRNRAVFWELRLLLWFLSTTGGMYQSCS